MRIAICDDEKLFLDRETALIERWADERGLNVEIHAFSNGDDLLRAHRHNYMDLIILDVIMPLLNGIDTAREIRIINSNIPIIFLTSSRDFAVDSYEVDAFYYLLKPVEESKLFSVLDKFFESSDQQDETFIAHTTEGFQKIILEEISYIEAQNKVVNMVLHNGNHIEIHEQFLKCEEMLTSKKGFFKCHRSYIVNLDHVRQFTKSEIIMDGVSIPISRNRYSEFKEAYFEHMFHE